MQAEIAAWIDPIHADRTAIGTISKALEEFGELLASERMSDPLEVADILILVLDLATIQGIDITAAVRAKLKVNRQRTWDIADNGAMKRRRRG